ncbi:MAG: OmpA family protein, partial [Candidatus Omnitrophica bacterium]|nr:OmpA family protein [Candidatus Omnitrophota bacterium]
MKRRDVSYITFLCVVLAVLCGCATNQKLVDSLTLENDRLRSQLMEYEDSLENYAAAESGMQNQIRSLQDEIARLNTQINTLQSTVVEVKDENASMLKTKSDLEKKLKDEIDRYQARLEMTEKGLVVSFLTEILFDSGKAEVKPEGVQALAKVGDTLKSNRIDNMIAIEGHTDNVPIKYSSWKSNWELSSARALSVLHDFIDNCGIDPKQISAIAYGEYQPRESNDTEEGRKQNR